MSRIMDFDLHRSIHILERTPFVMIQLLRGLPSEWTYTAGDKNNWRPYDVVGHLIHGERTDWIPRARIILDQAVDGTFEPFDRFAQFEDSSGKGINDLLEEFAGLRRLNLDTLRSWRLTDSQLDLTATHPELGKVSLRQLLATWVVHDLNHIRQTVAVMARRYENEVGPWREYLAILK